MTEGAALAPEDTGRVVITSVPADARVTIDGRQYGGTPLTIDDLPAGSYTLLLESRAGAVRRTMTIHPGETTTVSEPIYAGWIAVFSPVRLEIFERGRQIGTSEDGRIMVSPGAHELLVFKPPSRMPNRSRSAWNVGAEAHASGFEDRHEQQRRCDVTPTRAPSAMWRWSRVSGPGDGPGHALHEHSAQQAIG